MTLAHRRDRCATLPADCGRCARPRTPARAAARRTQLRPDLLGPQRQPGGLGVGGVGERDDAGIASRARLRAERHARAARLMSAAAPRQATAAHDGPTQDDRPRAERRRVPSVSTSRLRSRGDGGARRPPVALAKRSAGFFSRQRPDDSRSGISRQARSPGAVCERSGGVPRQDRGLIVPAALSPRGTARRAGRELVQASPPKREDDRFGRRWASPRTCSGSHVARHGPRICPAVAPRRRTAPRVVQVAPGSGGHDGRRLHASPKSRTLTRPSLVSITLAGLRSRCDDAPAVGPRPRAGQREPDVEHLRDRKRRRRQACRRALVPETSPW